MFNGFINLIMGLLLGSNMGWCTIDVWFEPTPAFLEDQQIQDTWEMSEPTLKSSLVGCGRVVGRSGWEFDLDSYPKGMGG